MKTGTIFNIQRFSVDDGPGIRTTVFFKGCPLSCVWCHNPESHETRRELFFYPQKCIGCGACAAVCPNGCHILTDAQTDFHTFDRSACVRCGKCAEACCTKAIDIAGREATVEDILKEVRSDSIFYEESGGGMTVSGGEPLSQAAFVLELCTAAKAEGIHVAMETCGWASWETVEPFLSCVDLFLYDYKAEKEDHKRLTGVDNDRILENLEKLSARGAHIILRCPIVPDCNDTDAHFEAIAALAKRLDGIEGVHLEPYHPLGISKSEQLGKTPAYNNRAFLDRGTLTGRAEYIASVSGKPTRVN